MVVEQALMLTVTLRCPSEARASKGDGRGESGPCILRGSLRSRLRMTVADW